MLLSTLSGVLMVLPVCCLKQLEILANYCNWGNQSQMELEKIHKRIYARHFVCDLSILVIHQPVLESTVRLPISREWPHDDSTSQLSFFSNRLCSYNLTYPWADKKKIMNVTKFPFSFHSLTFLKPVVLYNDCVWNFLILKYFWKNKREWKNFLSKKVLWLVGEYSQFNLCNGIWC